MNLKFLNSMEKVLESGQLLSAQVTVGETEGVWHVMWTDNVKDGLPVRETWYEGADWEEMLAVFHRKLAMKQEHGYMPLLPLIDGSGLDLLDKRALHAGMLQFYGELHYDESVFEALRKWRLRQSAKEGKSPFIIASNRMLKMISAFLPHSGEELSQLPGFGKQRLALYTEEITAITGGRERSTAFPLDWVEGQTDRSEFHRWLLQEQSRRKQADEQKRESKRKLLAAVARGASVETVMQETKLNRREIIAWVEELDKEGYSMEAFIDVRLSEVDEEQKRLAWDAFEKHGDKYLKPVMQSVFEDKEVSGKEAELIYEWLKLLRMKYRRSVEAGGESAQGEEAS